MKNEKQSQLRGVIGTVKLMDAEERLKRLEKHLRKSAKNIEEMARLQRKANLKPEEIEELLLGLAKLNRDNAESLATARQLVAEASEDLKPDLSTLSGT